MSLTLNDFFLPDQAPDKHISFTVGGVERKMFGGSFFHSPSSDNHLTINLMKEHPLPCDIYYPITDYSIPPDTASLLAVFERVLRSDKDVYVGCFGGRGRTGLFMAAFLKHLGDPTPVASVRKQYNEHAVETAEQMAYVHSFPTRAVPSLSKMR